jgi:hypothetical protein
LPGAGLKYDPPIYVHHHAWLSDPDEVSIFAQVGLEALSFPISASPLVGITASSHMPSLFLFFGKKSHHHLLPKVTLNS